jgi:hypothetical protein
VILDGWQSLAETARKAGVSERTMRRRMVALHQQLGGNVLRTYTRPGQRVGKWWVNLNVLQAKARELQSDNQSEPESTEVALGEHLLRIERVEKRLQALRDSHIALKNKVKQLTLPGLE